MIKDPLSKKIVLALCMWIGITFTASSIIILGEIVLAHINRTEGFLFNTDEIFVASLRDSLIYTLGYFVCLVVLALQESNSP